MNKFLRIKGMHQFYRDVFTRDIYLPEAGVMPEHVVAAILSGKLTISGEQPETIIHAFDTGLDVKKDDALKKMLCAIAIANRALDENNEGYQREFPVGLSTNVIKYLESALEYDNNINYLIAAIQILFRINEISAVLFLIEHNFSAVDKFEPVMKILLLISLMEGDHILALDMIKQLLLSKGPQLAGDMTTSLMITCGLYQAGGMPENFIDFRPLNNSGYAIDYSGYTWLSKKESATKTTVLIACDKHYYFEHALPAIYSIYETNRDELDVHLHLYNSDDEVNTSVMALRQRLPELHISASVEYIAANCAMNVSYACRRFVFLSYALKNFNTPIIGVDADVLIRKRWSLPASPASDLLLMKGDTSPFWEDVLGSFLYAEPSDVAQKYFDAVARFIDVNLKAGNYVWFLDQVALSASLDVLTEGEQTMVSRPARSSLIDLNHKNDVFCWLVTTVKNAEGPYKQYKSSLIEKYQHSPFSPNPAGERSPDRSGE